YVGASIVIEHFHPPATLSAKNQSLQQGASFARRTGTRWTFAIGLDLSLDALESLPRHVRFVMIPYQHVPLLARLISHFLGWSLIRIQKLFHLAPAVAVGAGINRMRQNAAQMRVIGPSPTQPLPRAAHDRNLQAVFAHRGLHPVNRAPLLESCKRQLDGRTDLFVGCLHHPARFIPLVSGRQAETKLTALGFTVHRFDKRCFMM